MRWLVGARRSWHLLGQAGLGPQYRRLTGATEQRPATGNTADADSRPNADAFEKGLPYLFRTNATLFSLVGMLALIGGYNAYLDWEAGPEGEGMACKAEGEVRKILSDGHILMQDGSIVRHSTPAHGNSTGKTA